MKSTVIKTFGVSLLLTATSTLSLFAEDKFNPPVTYSNPPIQNQQSYLDAKISSKISNTIETIKQSDLQNLQGNGLIDPGTPQAAAEGRCPRIPQNGYDNFSLYRKNFFNSRTRELRTLTTVYISSVIINLRPMQVQQWIVLRDSQGCYYEFSPRDHATVLQQFETIKGAASAANNNTLLDIGVNSCENNSCVAELVYGSFTIPQ